MHKILVADDSSTIQKVIKITLANEPFELVECLSSDDLESMVQSSSPDIVLLDFNLSEDKTGYELAQDIKNIKGDIQILMLFGTFDTIDEELMIQSGVNYKIVKPFDGSKFITLCNAMKDSFSTSKSLSQTESFEDSAELPGVIEETGDDEWVMDSPSADFDENPEVEETFPDPIEEDSSLNSLQASVEDWGMDVPGVIGQPESTSPDIPGVIEPKEMSLPDPIELSSDEVTTEEIVVENFSQTSEESVLPSSDDLAFPSDDDLAFPDESDLAFPDEIELETETKKPELVSLPEIDEVEEIPLALEQEGTNTEEGVASLVDAISDEMDDGDLWSADEFEEKDDSQIQEVKSEVEIEKEDSFVPLAEDDLPQIQPHNLSEVKEEFDIEAKDTFEDLNYIDNTPEDFPADVMDEPKEIETFSTPEPAPAAIVQGPSDDELKELIKKKMEPMVEEIVKEYCRANIEKIAWEVIPDLAENLIKKEIEKISDSVLNS